MPHGTGNQTQVSHRQNMLSSSLKLSSYSLSTPILKGFIQRKQTSLFLLLSKEFAVIILVFWILNYLLTNFLWGKSHQETHSCYQLQRPACCLDSLFLSLQALFSLLQWLHSRHVWTNLLDKELPGAGGLYPPCLKRNHYRHTTRTILTQLWLSSSWPMFFLCEAAGLALFVGYICPSLLQHQEGKSHLREIIRRVYHKLTAI